MEKIAELAIGKEILECFDIGEVRRIRKAGKQIDSHKDEIIIELREKTKMKPIIGEGIKLESKGFNPPLELIEHPIGGLVTYIKIYRRKWRDKKTKRTYQNHYEQRFPGTKLTQKFALFLKGEDRDKINELFRVVPHLYDLIKEDLLVVQESSIRIRRPWYKRIFKKR